MTRHLWDDWSKNSIPLFFFQLSCVQDTEATSRKNPWKGIKAFCHHPCISQLRRVYSSCFYIAVDLFGFWLNLKQNKTKTSTGLFLSTWLQPESLEKMECQLGKHYRHIAYRHVCVIFSSLLIEDRGFRSLCGVPFWTGGPGRYKNSSWKWAWKQTSKQISLMAPAWVPALNSLGDKLWCRNFKM